MKKLSLVLVLSLFVSMVAYGADWWTSPNPEAIRPISDVNYVGIGTNNPAYPLHVNGTVLMTGFRLTTGATNGYVLTSNSSGVGTWQRRWSKSGSNLYYNSGNVGIGSASPGEKLVVNGNLKISGNNKITSSGILTIEGNPGSFSPATLKLVEAGDAYLYGGAGGGDQNHVILAHTGSEAWGNVGIGTSNPQSRLAVNGTITAKEIEVQVGGWPDFVFEDSYKLMPLSKLEKHIKKEKSLPGIPTNKKAIEEGVKLGEMQAKLLQKVEELTLYVIGQDKELTELREEVGDLRKENRDLRQEISSLSN